MKLLLLCREPRLYSCQRIQQAAYNRGHQLDILDPNKCLLKLNQNAKENQFELYYQQDIQSLAYCLPNYDAILPRFGIASTKMGCAVLRHYQAKQIYCLNIDLSFAQARDKWKSLQLLAQSGIAIPTSILSGSEYSTQQAIDNLQPPMVLKTLVGTQGVGVILAKEKKNALSILQLLNQSKIPVLLQDFIAESSGIDLRCLVLGGKVIASIVRKGQEGEFRANFHQGGLAEPVELTEQEKHIAITASSVLNLELAGVDMIRSKSGPLVLEVNASPGLELAETVTKIDIAAQIIEYVEKNSTNISY